MQAELNKWGHLFEHAGWGIAICDADRETIELMNFAFARMHGYEMDELLGHPFLDVFSPRDHSGFPSRLLTAREKGNCAFESLSRKKDGSDFPSLVNLVKIEKDRGKSLQWAINVQDISERRQAEEALLKSEESLRETQKIAGMGSWEWEIISDRVSWSDETFSIYGLTPDQFGSRLDSYLELLHPEDLNIVKDSIHKTMNENRPFDLEHRIIRADGAIRFVHERGQVFRDSTGEPIRLVGTIRDLTDYRESLRERQKLEMAVEQAYDWILITDRDGTIEYVNEAVESITGYSKEELLGENPRILKSGKYDNAFYKEMWNTILSGKHYQAIVINKHKNGSLFEVYHSITPLKDENGNISHFVATSKDITQQKILEEKLNHAANFDSVTDLPNRMLFMDRLEQVISRAEHHNRNVAVAYIDIDRFSIINDTHGYEFGDAVLREVGKRLTGSTRDGDTVARFGADEFGMILGDVAHSDDAARVIDKLVRTIRESLVVEGLELILTLSIGVALYPNDGEEAADLLRNADIAMSKAKGSGMNNYQFYQSDMNVHAAEFVLLERHLHKALKTGEFILHYQPYFHAQTGTVAGMEALLRWNSEDLGFVMPGRFISVLEDTGMIIEVGQWVLQTVCNQLKAWKERGYSIVPVAVNLSAVQFRQKAVVEAIGELLISTGVDPRMLTLEITERTFMEDLDYTGTVLKSLKNLGLRLAIDDFGTGYSSLSYLKRFPLDILKIDISFIRDIAENPDDEAIVSAIISLAHGLNLQTVAEGVETEAQLKILRRLNCDLIQGFYFTRPAYASDVEAFLGD